MIVICKLSEAQTRAECTRRGIVILDLREEKLEVEFSAEEAMRDKVRNWYAEDDSVLWFSSL